MTDTLSLLGNILKGTAFNIFNYTCYTANDTMGFDESCVFDDYKKIAMVAMVSLYAGGGILLLHLVIIPLLLAIICSTRYRIKKLRK